MQVLHFEKWFIFLIPNSSVWLLLREREISGSNKNRITFFRNINLDMKQPGVNVLSKRSLLLWNQFIEEVVFFEVNENIGTGLPFIGG